MSPSQILSFRRKAGALEERLPAGPKSLRQAAWAGLQDSMPRARQPVIWTVPPPIYSRYGAQA